MFSKRRLGRDPTFRLLYGLLGLQPNLRLLTSGTHTPEDITWMKHEMAERWHEQRHGSTYKESHGAAEKKWPGNPWVGEGEK